MLRSSLILVTVSLLHALFTGPATAAEEEKKAPADPTGSWFWDYTFDENTVDFSLKLDWDGKELTGKYTAFDNTTKITDATLKDDTLSFAVQREFNGNKMEVQFDGKVEKDDIRGTVVVDFGDEPREFDWHAKRHVGADDVLGTWELRIETPNGVVEPRLTIAKDDERLHGTYESVFGEREAKNIKIKDNELSWEVSSDEDEQFDFKIVYRAKPRGNAIEGANEFDFGGNTGTMEFSGKRLPPKKDKPAATATLESES